MKFKYVAISILFLTIMLIISSDMSKHLPSAAAAPTEKTSNCSQQSGAHVTECETITTALKTPVMVKEMYYPTPQSSHPSDLTLVNDQIFFVARKAPNEQLFRSDGTAEGAVLLQESSEINIIDSVNNKLIFAQWNKANTALELWISDGTQIGTQIITSFSEEITNWYQSYIPSARIDGVIIFTLTTDIGECAIWRTDGTQSGTYSLIITPEHHCTGLLQATSDSIFFGTHTSGGPDPSIMTLWQSDGTVSGTTAITTLDYGYNIRATSIQETLYFSYRASLNDVNALWKSNGTEAGTVLIEEFGQSIIRRLVNFDNTLYFSVQQGQDFSLWKSDGTSGGTAVVKENLPPIQQIILLDNHFYLATGDSTTTYIWQSDGTENGTHLIIELPLNDDGYTHVSILELADSLYVKTITGYGQLGGQDKVSIWKSDGTQEGTILLEEFLGLPGIDVWWTLPSFLKMKGDIYFSAGNEQVGHELWKIEGSTSTIGLLHNIVPDFLPYEPDDVIQVDNWLYFTLKKDGENAELWRSDGTETGTTRIFEGAAENLIAYQGNLFFTYDDHLWQADQNGTITPVKDLDHVQAASPRIIANNKLFILARTGIWLSDGTQAGTEKVLSFDRYPHELYFSLINETLYFTLVDEALGSGRFSRAELWKFNPISEEFEYITSIPAGNSLYCDSGTPNESIHSHKTTNDHLFIAIFARCTNSLESNPVYAIWRSDGTEEGTYKILDTVWYSNVLGSTENNLYLLTDDVLWKSNDDASALLSVQDNMLYINTETFGVENTLFFSRYYEEDGVWVSDGTAEGTQLIKPGAGGSHFTDAWRTVYFSSEELWQSDGTEPGTTLVADINPEGNSNPTHLTNVHDTLFFFADDGEHGLQLWAYNHTNLDNVLYLPTVGNTQSISCEELLTKDKIWQGELAWSCDYDTKQKGTMSLKITAVSLSIAELYSPLIPVQPNQTYEVSYWVRTDLEIDGSEMVGRVVASQYNFAAQEEDGLQDNRIDAGFDLGENANLDQDWEHKSYTFTTTAETRFVRLRAIMGGQNGSAKGAMWLDNVSLVKQ